MAKKYTSKVSYGLLIFIFLVFFMPFAPEIMKNALDIALIMILLPLTIVFGFIVHMLFRTQYTIEGNQIKIRMGLFSYKPVDIVQIKEISKTRSLLSSPAASFDRIKLNTENMKRLFYRREIKPIL